MQKNTIQLALFLILIIVSCSKKVDYTSEFMQQTSGRYLYNPDAILEVYYENNKLLLKWRGAEKIEPVVIDENTFFIVDMYKKLRFVQDPETQKRYLSIIPEGNPGQITYDFLKVADTFKTPSMYLKSNEYHKALTGFLEIQKQDSTSVFIEEGQFNRYGYELMRKKEIENAIQVFNINVMLYPESSNAYDSLADAYLRSGDSLQAFNNYKTALEYNNGNRRAKKFVDAFKSK